jgi:hypothetical protein
VSIDDVKEVAVPASADLPAYQYLALSVTYENVSSRPVWVVGWAEDWLAETVETRGADETRWVDDTPLMCGTGITTVQVAAGESHSFRATLGPGHGGNEVRVSLRYGTDPPVPLSTFRRRQFDARSEPRRIEPPGRAK